MTVKKYQTIVVDPPWKYGSWGLCSGYTSGSPRGAMVVAGVNKFAMPYKTLTVEQISSLPVGNLAAENCECYLWTTQKYLPAAFGVLQRWGFTYCQTLTWCKQPRGTGQGGVYCPTTEFLLLGRRGRMPPVQRINSTWWCIKRPMEHSRKPEIFQSMIEHVTLPPRVELFARRKRNGWDVWGDEVESDITFNTDTKIVTKVRR